MCYYFDDIMTVKDIDYRDILLDEKYKNILIYDILCKTFMGSKSLHFRFDEIDGFIKIYDEIRYLVFRHLWYDEILSGITNNINHNFARIRTDSYNSLPTEKFLTFHNIIILIKSVVNKNE